MAAKPSRVCYIDNLRVLLAGLVVLHHLAITYGAPGNWYYKNPQTSELATMALLPFVATNSAFLMQHYGMLAKLVKPQTIERTVRDADDDVVIATALAAHADIIVTGDNDLLVLHPYQDIQILNAADALNTVVPGQAE